MNEFVKNIYKQLILDLESVGRDDHELFCKLFREVVFLCGLRRDSVCHHFGCSHQTFEGYIDKRCSPAFGMKKPVCEWLVIQVKKDMKRKIKHEKKIETRRINKNECIK